MRSSFGNVTSLPGKSFHYLTKSYVTMANTMGPRLSVVIVNYNAADLLAGCTRSLFDATHDMRLEVFVVDSGSTDQSCELIATEDLARIHLIKNVRNVGFPAANNQALKLCEGDFIFLLNPDTVVLPGTCQQLVRFMERHPECGICGPHVLNSDGSTQSAGLAIPDIWSIVRSDFLGGLGLNRLFRPKSFPAGPEVVGAGEYQPFEADYVSGCALALSRTVMERIGLLDENLFWIEDVDWCWRARQAGYKVYVVPSARIIHYGGQSAKKNVFVAVANQYFNHLKFFEKHYSWKRLWGLRVFFLVELIPKAAIRWAQTLFSRSGDKRARLRAYLFVLSHLLHPPRGVVE